MLEFYRDAFQQRGWTVQDTAAFGLEGRFDFRDELTDIQGDVFAAPFTRSDRYTEVRIQVQTNPAREPVDPSVDLDDTPAATATPAGRTP